MQINNKRFLTFFYSIIMFSQVSCQTKKLYFTKYESLSLEKKQEVNTYLDKVKKTYPKKDNEITLMLSYGCFLNQSVVINKKIKKEFQEIENGEHNGKTSIINIKKDLKNIELKFSDGKKISISPKENYDYISICYNKNFKEWYIEYYNYPHLNFSE